MAIDYYEELRQISSELATQGLAAEAEALRNAMDAGATSTEILMAARWHLQQIEPLETIGSPTKGRIRELIRALERVLA